MHAMGEAGAVGRRMLQRGFDAVITAIDPDVATHLINSNRELMLAMRSFVDAEIRMADRAIEKVRRSGSNPAAQTPATPIITSGDV